MNETEEQIKEIKREKRTVLIQIKTFPGVRELLDILKKHTETTITELLEAMIKFHYKLNYDTGFFIQSTFSKPGIKLLLEKYFDVKEMARGLLISEKTK